MNLPLGSKVNCKIAINGCDEKRFRSFAVENISQRSYHQTHSLQGDADVCRLTRSPLGYLKPPLKRHALSWSFVLRRRSSRLRPAGQAPVRPECWNVGCLMPTGTQLLLTASVMSAPCPGPHPPHASARPPPGWAAPCDCCTVNIFKVEIPKRLLAGGSNCLETISEEEPWKVSLERRRREIGQGEEEPEECHL